MVHHPWALFSEDITKTKRCIIELVDSMCRDSVDMQYDNDQNLKIGKFINLYNNILFIFKCFYEEQHTQWHKKGL